MFLSRLYSPNRRAGGIGEINQRERFRSRIATRCFRDFKRRWSCCFVLIVLVLCCCLSSFSVRHGVRSKLRSVAPANIVPPRFKTVAPVDHQIVVVAKVGKEAAYMIEWIEFHRIQGVTKFVLYIDDTEWNDDLETLRLLPAYYRQLGYPNLIETRSIARTLQDNLADIVTSGTSGNLHRLTQQLLLKQAFVEFRDRTEWIGHFDIDEFFWSAKHDTLTGFLESLYNGEDNVSILYQAGRLAAMYAHSRPFGIGDSFWFDHKALIRRNPVTGALQLYYTEQVPNLTADSPQQRIKDMVKQLTDFANSSGKHPIELFEDVWRNQTQQQGLDNDYPLQIVKQVYRGGSIGDGDPLAILKRMADLWPECSAVLDEVEANPSYYQPLMSDLIRLKERLTDKGFPHWCSPGFMPQNLTTMGKTFIWTGNRFNPPPHYNFTDEVRRLHLDERPDRDYGMQRRAWRNTHLSFAKKPFLCEIPWVHGCAHSTEAIIQIHPDLMIDHHMLRSLESRTVGDSGWRSPSGWGKFQKEDKSLSFNILEFSSLIESSECSSRYAERLRQQIQRLHNPRKVKHEELEFAGNRIRHILELGDCGSAEECFNPHAAGATGTLPDYRML